MNGLRFYLTYAVRALRRSGQRTLLAMICVAFGVMSLIAMQALAGLLSATILMDTRFQLGGDLKIERPGSYLTGDDLAALDRMVAEGALQSYSPLSDGLWYFMKRENTGRVQFVMRISGVDPARYPLEGELTLQEPEGQSLQDVLFAPGDVAITRDLAAKHDLGIGDTFQLADENGSIPAELRVVAIIRSSPDRMGDRILYNLDTARLVTGRANPITSVSLLLAPQADPAAVVDALTAAGWSVATPDMLAEQNADVRDTFTLMLRGAGILGLLVGGIGVANTMQVLLARRTTEIAMLKTLGYRQIDLVMLFGLETLLLGLAGSVLGALAAIGFSIPLLNSFERLGSMLIEWTIAPEVLIGGMLAGTLTAFVFGVYIILKTSTVRPAVLLRNLPVRATWRSRLQTGGLFLLLAIPFTLLSSLIMESVVWGLAVVGLAVAGFIVLGLLMWLGLFVTVRLPLPGGTLLRLARGNLRRGRIRAVVALIALFVGVFAITFAATIILNARGYVDSQTGSIEDNNLLIMAESTLQDQVDAALAAQGIGQAHYHAQVPVTGVSLRQAGTEPAPMDRVLRVEGRPAEDGTWDISLQGQPWGQIADGIYLPDGFVTDERLAAIQAGDLPEVAVITEQGAEVRFQLAGFYRVNAAEDTLTMAPRGALTTLDALASLSDTQAMTFLASAPVARLSEVTEALGLALPQAMVTNAIDANAFINQTLNNLFVAAVAVAGLALVAGAVLIANSVGLAMVERRYEMAILKTVGYSQAQVMRTILLEHTILGLLAGVAGLGGVVLAVALINTQGIRPELVFNLPPALAVMLVGVIIALASAAMVAWQPTRARPLAVLRGE